YGDYDESCIFAYAAALVIESYYRYYHLENKKVVALFNEWTLGMGALYIRKKVPAIGTIFITHATSIGRSIAGNNKPLYGYLSGYNGDQMAQELNMEAKHSVEKQAAHHAHCFTTVSDITATECEQLLEKAPDVVTLNGFEHDFVPKGEAYVVKRKAARKALYRVAEALLGYKLPDNALLIGTSGRYEYRNKGLDLFIEALNQTRSHHDLQKEIVAFIMVPGWVKGFRDDLRIKLDERDMFKSAPLPNPVITHDLYEQENDKILQYLSFLQMNNKPEENVKVIFVPCYLDGCDGIFNMSYYDLLIGFDATVFPSYYEPWGYTPLESIAFGIPTITTNLAGFGLWADKALGGTDLKKGVAMIHRTDFNYNEAAAAISKELVELSKMSKGERTEIRKHCLALADEACWSHFIRYYLQAFDIALNKASEEVSN
ncbi:MAG TPA: glycosyl transferase, partial [Porphyromonadaceae bacterium]|nr:glycosyl transferase [Porphyromonadaceae bacterium]